MDADLQSEARKAVAGLDLAAWERVRALMLRAGAAETEAAAIERASNAERFLADLAKTRDAILSADDGLRDDAILHGGAANEADLVESLLDYSRSMRSRPGASGRLMSYIKIGDVVFALNRSFGVTGWSVKIDSLRFLDRPHRTNSRGLPDDHGTYWSAIVIAVATLTIKGPGGRTAERQEAGVGQAVGGKSTTRFDATNDSIKSAMTAALKSAARFVGPATGLMLQFDEPLHQEIVEKLKTDIKRFRGEA